MILAHGVCVRAEDVDAQSIIKGRELAFRLVNSAPSTTSSQSGALLVRSPDSKRTVPFATKINITADGWENVFQAGETNNLETLVITHRLGKNDSVQMSPTMFISASPNVIGQPNKYAYSRTGETNGVGPLLNGYLVPFAGSDFWLCDLGLEFFHWPQQQILPKSTNLKRGRSYTLLESTNPNPPTNGYSRVLSWIDQETGGILQAEAYDANGKLLKVFEPKSFKKINGQWELQEMEIRNVQTGSRTRLEFDLKKSGE